MPDEINNSAAMFNALCHKLDDHILEEDTSAALRNTWMEIEKFLAYDMICPNDCATSYEVVYALSAPEKTCPICGERKTIL